MQVEIVKTVEYFSSDFNCLSIKPKISLEVTVFT